MGASLGNIGPRRADMGKGGLLENLKRGAVGGPQIGRG